MRGGGDDRWVALGVNEEGLRGAGRGGGAIPGREADWLGRRAGENAPTSSPPSGLSRSSSERGAGRLLLPGVCRGRSRACRRGCCLLCFFKATVGEGWGREGAGVAPPPSTWAGSQFQQIFFPRHRGGGHRTRVVAETPLQGPRDGRDTRAGRGDRAPLAGASAGATPVPTRVRRVWLIGRQCQFRLTGSPGIAGAGTHARPTPEKEPPCYLCASPVVGDPAPRDHANRGRRGGCEPDRTQPARLPCVARAVFLRSVRRVGTRPRPLLLSWGHRSFTPDRTRLTISNRSQRGCALF